MCLILEFIFDHRPKFDPNFIYSPVQTSEGFLFVCLFCGMDQDLGNLSIVLNVRLTVWWLRMGKSSNFSCNEL